MPSDVSLQTLAPLTPWLIAAAIVLVVLAFRLYRRSGDPAEPGSNHLLLALRLAAIVLLVVFLLEPVLSLFRERSVPARVALLLDGSLSMSIPFPTTRVSLPAALLVLLDVLNGHREQAWSSSAYGSPVVKLPSQGRAGFAPFRGFLQPELQRILQVRPGLFEDSVHPARIR